MEEPSAIQSRTTTAAAIADVTTAELQDSEEEVQEKQQDAYSLFLYAMKSPVTRTKYSGRMHCFFMFRTFQEAGPSSLAVGRGDKALLGCTASVRHFD